MIVAGDNEIEVTDHAVEPTPQETRAFGATEEAWLNRGNEYSRALSIKYGSGGELDPEELDRIFSRWMAESGEKEADDVISNALGAAFGDYLVANYGFQWVILTDEYGTEYAVRHGLGQTTAFPKASVQKRIEDGQTEFFQNVYLIIVDQLRRGEAGG
jgi:hypothetical protein